MEGPSLYLAQEQLRPFVGKRIERVSGNTRIDKERCNGKEVQDIFSWGKHLLFQFDTFALRTHFLLYGTFEATVEGKTVTGDYRKSQTPRLAFSFANGEIAMFNCSVKLIDDPCVKNSCDFSIDIMSPHWDEKKALAALAFHEDEEIADVLLDQEMFAGVGNIIKNEILSQAFVHPERKVRDLPEEKREELVQRAREFSHQFYLWRKKFALRAHLRIHNKGACPHCGGPVTHKKTGKRNRRSHFCERCQVL